MLKKKLSTCYPEDPFYSPLDKRFGRVMGYDFRNCKEFYRLKIGRKEASWVLAKDRPRHWTKLSLDRGLLTSSDINKMEEYEGGPYITIISPRTAGRILTQQMYQQEKRKVGGI